MRKQKIYIFHVYLQIAMILKTGIHKEGTLQCGWVVCMSQRPCQL